MILLVSMGLHFITIERPQALVFDEVHYVPEARSIIAGEGPTNLHPPIAKLFIVSGIRLFGDNPFGWRFFSVIFGTISIALFYFICRKIGMSKTAQFLATFIFAFENLSFVMSGIGMLDVFMVTFMLGAFLLYLKKKDLSAGLFFSLNVLCKIIGIFSFFTIILDWLLGS